MQSEFMVEELKKFLPNNSYNDLNYKVVHGIIYDSSAIGNSAAKPTTVGILNLAYVLQNAQ